MIEKCLDIRRLKDLERRNIRDKRFARGELQSRQEVFIYRQAKEASLGALAHEPGVPGTVYPLIYN